MRALAAALLLSLSMHGQKITASVNPVYPPVTIPATFFGMNVGDTVNRNPSLLFGWLGTNSRTSMYNLNPSKGTYSWTVLDQYIAFAQAHNAQPILILNGTPQWAAPQPANTNCIDAPGACDPFVNIADFDALLNALMSHLGTLGNPVVYFTFGNEMQDPHYWTGTPALAVTYMQHLRSIVTAAYPAAKILSPSVTSLTVDGATWLQAYLTVGGGAVADILNFHSYIDATAENIGTVTSLVRYSAKPAGFGSLPVWNTEGDWAGFNNYAMPLAQQPAYIAKYFLLQWSQGIQRVLWYGYDAGPIYGGLVTSDGNGGSTDTLTIGGTAYAEVRRWMVGAAMPTGCQQTGSLYTCQLSRTGWQGVAVWSTSGTPAYSVPATYTLQRTLTGAESFVSTSITLSAEPVLLETATLPIGTNPMSVMLLGTNQSFGGYVPFLPSDILQTDITNAPLSSMNARFQQVYGAQRLYMNPGIINNTVDSSTQPGFWYKVITNDGDNTMLFLTGTERFEGQTSTVTPFTCWSTNNLDPTGGDHHLIVSDKSPFRKNHTEIYQEEMCDGVIYAYSAKVWDSTKSADHQNFAGGDSTDAAGLVLLTGAVRHEDAVRGTVNYATRFTVGSTAALFYNNGTAQCGMVAPATHGSHDKCTGDATMNQITLPYGARLRLKASFDVSGYAPEIQGVLNAQKHQGLYFADTGGPGKGYFQADDADNWNVDAVNSVSPLFSNYELVYVGSDVVQSFDTNDDASGSDSIVSSFSQTATGVTPGTAGAYTVAHAIVPNPYNRPTINTFTASPTTVAIGGSVTFTLNDANATVHYVDNAGAFSGNTLTWTPTQTATYTAYSRGPYGIVKGPSVTVGVTGTNAAAPVASSPAGNFTTVQTTSFTTPTSGGVVHLTTDGTSANCNSPLASNPYTITTPTSFSTMACGSGLISSAVTPFVYNVNIPVTKGVVQSAAGSVYGATTLTTSFANVPAGGNLLVAFVSYPGESSTEALTVPAGWTRVSHTHSAAVSYFDTFTAISDGTNSFTVSDQSARLSIVLHEVIGAVTSNPIAAFNNAATTNTTGNLANTSFTTGAATPTTAGQLVFAAVNAAFYDSSKPATISSGWKLVAAINTNYNNVVSAYRQAFTADATTPISNTFAYASGSPDRDDSTENSVTLILNMQ